MDDYGYLQYSQSTGEWDAKPDSGGSFGGSDNSCGYSATTKPEIKNTSVPYSADSDNRELRRWIIGMVVFCIIYYLLGGR